MTSRAGLPSISSTRGPSALVIVWYPLAGLQPCMMIVSIRTSPDSTSAMALCRSMRSSNHWKVGFHCMLPIMPTPAVAGQLPIVREMPSTSGVAMFSSKP
jgi:hypothetical protein